MSPFNFALASVSPNHYGISLVPKCRNDFFFRRFVFVNLRFGESL